MDFKANHPHPHSTTPTADFRKAIGKIRERFWIYLTILLICGGGAAFYAFRQTPIYQARSTIQMEDEKSAISLPGESRGDYDKTIDALNTVVQSVNTQDVLRRVVRTNNLAADEAFLSAFKGAPPPDEDGLVRALASMTIVKLRRNTRLIDVAFEHPNPVVAKKLANSVVQEFMRQKVTQKLNATTSDNGVLLTEATKLKVKLEQSERALQAYKELSKTSALDDKQSVLSENMRSASASYNAAKAKRLQLQADLETIQSRPNEVENILSLPSLTQDTAVNDLRQKLLTQETFFSTTTNRYKAKHPKYILAQQQLAEARNAFNKIAANAPQLIKQELERMEAQEKNLESAVTKVNQEAIDLDAKRIQYNVLLRDVESDRALYDQVLARLKQTDVSKSVENKSVSILESASQPMAPIRPQRGKITAFGLFGGLLIGFIFFLFIDKFDSSIRTVDEAEAQLGLPVLGAIPRTKNQLKNQPLVLIEEPHSTCAESIRSFRAAIEMLGREEDRRIMLFTSATPSEGKSFTSLNIACALAQQGKRVLIIDLDLRRPAVAHYLQLDETAPGVTNYLLGKAGLAELVQKLPQENLFVLSSGPKVPNPAEQLSGKWIGALIQDAAKQFDFVVIDTAPLNAVSDTLYLLQYIQALFLVVRAGKTPLPGIRRVLEQVRRANVKVAGLVLNYLPQSAGYGYYYYYSHTDGYYSDGVYGATDRDKRKEPKRKTRPKAQIPETTAKP